MDEKKEDSTRTQHDRYEDLCYLITTARWRVVIFSRKHCDQFITKHIFPVINSNYPVSGWLKIQQFFLLEMQQCNTV